MTKEYDLPTVFDLLMTSFSPGEINTLSYDLFQEVFRNFDHHMSTSEKIELVVDFANQNARIPELLHYVEKNKSKQFLRFAPKLKKSTKEYLHDISENHEPLSYNDKEQPWSTFDFPEFKEIDLQAVEKLWKQIDVVILTATPVELKAVLGLLDPYPRRKRILVAYLGAETYYLGKFGAYRAVVSRCRIGSEGAGGSTLATESAIRYWNPKAILMTGIAFGADSLKQNIGDVLIASQIIPYEKQRVGQRVIFRSPIPPSNATLLNRFENALGWRFLRPNGDMVNRIVGPILSGEKLIDDPVFKASLFEQYPDAIGGEMEGSGLAAAAGRANLAWILVKGICDWGDGHKHGNFQAFAAAASASLVHHVLSRKTVLNSIIRQ